MRYGENARKLPRSAFSQHSRPLAFTKTFSMFFAALLGTGTLVPVLMVWLIRGKITPRATQLSPSLR